MKKFISAILAGAMVLSLSACQTEQKPEESAQNSSGEITEEIKVNINDKKAIAAEHKDAVLIDFDEEITAEGVTVGGDIIYYQNLDEYESKNPYGEGNEKDKHTEAEAAEHKLVTITEPGEYLIMGELKGQLAVDLGEEAKTDPEAVVTLIFGGANITCEIAPAVIFYNVYECAEGKTANKDVDISNAGANVVIADNSESNINGSYVAKIYKDNAEEEKLHKYDGAFYSKMSMNIYGGEKDNGILNIKAENEGLDSELHLAVNGGIINIEAQNDGINTNEDGVSVTAINGGTLNVIGGLGSEGDGIDSNGWLVINGGTVIAHGSGRTGDGGIDADNGIYIGGGTVAAFGSRNDPIKPVGDQVCVQLTFSSVRGARSTVKFIDEAGYGMVAESEMEFQSLVLSGENLEKDKEYSLYINDIMQEYSENRSSLNSMNNIPFPFNSEFERPDESDFEDKFKDFENAVKNDPVPEGFDEWLENAKDIPEDIRTWLEGFKQNKEPEEKPENKPEENRGSGEGLGHLNMEESSDKTKFVISDSVWNFSGIYDSPKATGKEHVTFTVNGRIGIDDIFIGDIPEIDYIECSKDVPKSQIQLTLEYIGGDDSISVSRICLLSEGDKAVKALFEELPLGKYCLTVAVVAENSKYSGSSAFNFSVVD